MKNTNTTQLLSVDDIVKNLQSDTQAYSETLDKIANEPNYFTANDCENQKYWSDWFNGSDMKDW
jgi:hypothetical protein